MLAKKIMLAGTFGVGKSSLFQRFSQNVFSEKYLTTVGVKVDTKVISTVNNKIKVTLWDVAGEIDQKKVPNTYWLETSGVIYVIDLTRPSTLENLVEDIEYIKKTVPNALVKVVANKKDVACAEQIETANKTYPIDIITSAKTGENVEKLFEIIAKDIT